MDADKLTSAPTRLRQIALVCFDIEKAKSMLTFVLGVESIFEDPIVAQWGLRNFLVPVGGDFIEVVSPFKDGTTAGRLLEKRGQGGYMIIMQTLDAKQRRDFIKAQGFPRIALEHIHDEVVCVQYHPKGIKGGMMPELDSHAPGEDNPNPLLTRFSPWHACGPDYDVYSEGMKRSDHFTLEGCILRLQPEDLGHEAAARQWEETFGVARSRDQLAFVNARLGFIPGRQGEHEGLVSISLGVRGTDKYQAIMERAREMKVLQNGYIEMCGVKWYLSLTGHNQGKSML